MNKYIIGIDGMMCGMCEIHVEECVRKNIKTYKVKASHRKNQLEVLSELNLVEDDFHRYLDPTGYRITSFSKGTAIKKFIGWK